MNFYYQKAKYILLLFHIVDVLYLVFKQQDMVTLPFKIYQIQPSKYYIL